MAENNIISVSMGLESGHSLAVPGSDDYSHLAIQPGKNVSKLNSLTWLWAGFISLCAVNQQ